MAYLLDQLLDRSARLHPERQAVSFKDQSQTYSELDSLANQIAHSLLEQGIQPGDRVGILAKKRLESLAAVFGVLRAGAVYVPLDPGAPDRRLAYIINDCGIRALLTTAGRVEGLCKEPDDLESVATIGLLGDEQLALAPANRDLKVVDRQQLATLSTDPLPLRSTVESDLAYILYTSGSTGEPKGVMISHRAAMTFVDWAYNTFEFRETDRVSSHAPLHFDLSILDIFSSVKAGAAVVLVPEELSVFPYQLADFIENERISIWYSVPSVLTSMVLHAELARHEFASLRTVLFAGEVFPIKYLRELMRLVPDARYYNLYGPTETNVCTYYDVESLPAPDAGPLSIGRACANTATVVVGEDGAIVEKGEVGELYVRGPSLLSGYWGRPERTSQSLVRESFGLPFMADYYRTGDLVKEEPDGNYTFLGRRDNMIKSRGYRIELGDIETALYAHPAVIEAAALAIPHDEFGNIIGAAVVANEDLSAGDLRRFCSDRIPRYMIPERIQFMQSLPKTSTGKVDRTTLTSGIAQDT